MFTQCPHCHATYSVNAEQLREQRGLWQCTTCKKAFDALELISDDANIKLTPESEDFLATPVTQSSKQPLFAFGSLILAFLLMAQLTYFESSTLIQTPQSRIWLEWACQHLNCQLPPYRQLSEIKIQHSSFQVQNNQHYHLQFTLLNEAEFSQLMPIVELTLQNFNGKIFAQRHFPVNSYSPTQQILKPNDLIAISLIVAKSDSPIGGYQLELF